MVALTDTAESGAAIGAQRRNFPIRPALTGNCSYAAALSISQELLDAVMAGLVCVIINEYTQCLKGVGMLKRTSST